MSYQDFRFYFSLLMRRLPQFLLIAFTVTTLGVLVIILLPNKYKSTAEILVESPQISAKLAPSTVPDNAVEQLGIYQQEIMTRRHLLQLAKKFDVFGPRAATMKEADIIKRMRAQTSFDLVSDARNGPGATIFSVSFEDRDPEVSAGVVNELVSMILEKNTASRNRTASETLQFFSSEVARLNNQLKGFDSRILEFKNAHRDALPDSLGFRRTEQSAQQQRLQMLDWEEAGLRNRRSNLIQMFEATGAVGTAAAATPEQQTLQELKRTLSDQLVLFSAGSPNIVALKARIAALEASIRHSAPPADAASQAGRAGGPPSQLDMQLSDIDQRLEFISKEKASIAKSLASLAKTIAATPDNETILNAMERNRQNTQSQYSAAVERYAAASTGKEIEADSKGERFSVVEPAIPPAHATWPKRGRLAALAALAGLVAAAGFVLLTELVNRSVRRPSELVSALQIRPIATIPSIARPAPRLLKPGYVLGLVALAGVGQLFWINSAGNH